MPWPWLSVSTQIWIRSFKWDKDVRILILIFHSVLTQRRFEFSGNFLSTSNFDLWYFCSLLTYKSVQYLIWKIWFISVWRLKARAMAWLLTWFMFAQSTLISYHTEAFVKTEVGCTVKKKIDLGIHLQVKKLYNLNCYIQNTAKTIESNIVQPPPST